MKSLLAAAILFAACAGGPQRREDNLVGVNMSREEILAYGTRRYPAKPADVYKAAVGALKAIGYDIATESPEKGVILTSRKLVRVVPTFAWGYGAATTTHTRQFVVRLFADDKTNEVVVTALPKVFEGDFDISEKPVWDLRGERLIWHDLFTQMNLFLR